jgi:outer membrane protein TolC
LTKVAEVMNTYYDLVQQQQQLMALDSTIAISKQRVELSNNRYTIGKAAKLELLNAQVDLNTDQTNYLRQQELYANTKTKLNEIMARDVNTDFTVVNNVAVDNTLLLPDLTALAEKQNPELLAQFIGKRIAELNLKQVRANRFPTVGINTGYNWSESKSSLGFTSESYAKGLNYGFSASINVFNGFLQKRNERIARLQIENSTIAIEQQRQVLNSQLTSTYQTYLTNIQLIELESKNETIAKQNLDITLEKYRIGTINTLEYRTAQLNYLNAKVRHSVAQFEAKLSEIALKSLAGNLNLE